MRPFVSPRNRAVDMRSSFIAAGYDPSRERAWHLSTWLAPDLHAWCVHDIATGACVALVAESGSELPQTERMPVRPARVTFTALPEISTLVPESALAPGSEMRHLKMVHGHLPTGLLRDEPIAALGARCVYLHDELAEHRLVQRYPNAHSLPLQAVLVQYAMARSAHRPTVLIHRSATRLDLAITRDHQLLLSNTFHVASAEDVLYFTLYAIEQCALKPDAVSTQLSGTHLSTAESGLLARYLPDVAPASPTAAPPSDAQAPQTAHAYLALLEQSTCAS